MLESFLRQVASAACLLLLPFSFAAAETAPAADLETVGPELRPALEAAGAEVEALGPSSPPAARAEAWGRLGMLHLHSGASLPAAERCFATAAEAQPDQMRWLYYLGVVQQRQGQPAKAAASLRRALEVRGGNVPVVLRLAGLLAELGEREEASELYTAALQSPYAVAGAQAGLGRLALARGDAARAVAAFEAALAAQPEASALRLELSRALFAAGDKARGAEQQKLAGPREVSWPDPLLAQLELIAQAPRAASEDPRLDGLRRAVEAAPADATARRALAQALGQNGDLAGAQEQYEEILRRQQGEARDYLTLGSLKADRQGDPAAGMPDIRKALEMDPQLYLAHQRLGVLEMAAGQPQQAVEHWQRALAIEPGLSPLRLALARALFALERLPESLAAVDELLRREPGNIDALLMHGRILAGQNQPEVARKDFERAATAGAAAPSQRAEAFYCLGLIHQASNDVEAAIAEYRRALEQDVAHVPTLAALGPILAGRGDLEGALPIYQRLSSRQPENLEAKYRLAALQLQRGDAEAAQVLFEELYRAQPALPEFVVSSALLLAERGQAEAGIERIDRGLAAQQDKQVKRRLLAARARIEIGAGRIDDGVASYREVLRLQEQPEVHLELAQALTKAARYPSALLEYQAYLKARPQDERSQFARAMVLIWAGRWSEARDRLLEVTATSKNLELTHLLARVLACAPDARVRNGERALQIATTVFEKERNPVHGETLALAMAAAGRFPEAIGLQKRLLAEAEQAKFDGDFIARVKTNLARFEQGEIGSSNW